MLQYRFKSLKTRLQEAEKHMEHHKESLNSLNNITMNFIESQLRTQKSLEVGVLHSTIRFLLFLYSNKVENPIGFYKKYSLFHLEVH